jgi:DMATS type aromatic prenyltransferase
MTQFDTIATETTSIERSDLIANYPSIARHSQTGFEPEKLIPKPTYVEAGIEKLTALCDALGLEAKTDQAIDIFRGMTTSWGDKKVGDTSGWQSDVSDDLSPFEFSIAFKGDRAELRVLLEAQGSDPNLQSNWEAGIQLNQYLAEHFNVNLDRFEQIKDLFVPTNPDAKLAMWHAVCIYPDKEPEFKIYLNPQSKGASKAAAVVEESLVRLGFTHAWMGLAEVAAQRGPDRDDFIYFSLDLATHDRARVKVYLRHFDATAADLEQALSLAQNYVPGDVTSFCQTIAPEHSSFSAKPATTCFSWVEGDTLTASSATVYLPIGYYVTDDRVVRDRLDLYFKKHNLPVSRYDTALQSLAIRPLDAGVGMHSYIALSPEAEQRRMMVYLNPEVNEVRSPQKTFAAGSYRSLPSLEEMVWHYENHTLVDHPFFQRMEREQLNLEHIWLFFMNIRQWVTDVIPLLASIVGRIDDERIRCILVHQLNDELGNGNPDRIHSKLFEQFLTAIEPWRMKSFNEEMLVLGQEFDQRLKEIYLDPNPYVGIGAMMVMEVYGKQFDLWLAQELRKANVDLSNLTWLTLHEKMEVDHADENLLIALFVTDSEDGTKAARQGIEKACITSWKFLNGMYRLCPGEI